MTDDIYGMGPQNGEPLCPCRMDSIKKPNAETIKAMEEADRAGLPSFADVKALLADLEADDHEPHPNAPYKRGG